VGRLLLLSLLLQLLQLLLLLLVLQGCRQQVKNTDPTHAAEEGHISYVAERSNNAIHTVSHI
jgi:hypothetical protein